MRIFHRIKKLVSAKVLTRLVVLAASLSGCTFSSADNIPTITPYIGPTPAIYDFGNYSTITVENFPGSINCQQIAQPTPGPIWMGMKIGVTEFEEVLGLITAETDDIHWNSNEGNLIAVNKETLATMQWGLIRMCFYGNTLSALGVTAWRERPEFVEDWLALYGEPNLVTWGATYYDRSLIWLEQGILAVVDLRGDVTLNVLFFSPIAPQSFNGSWLEYALPNNAKPFPGDQLGSDNIDEVPLSADREVENPWGFGEER